MKNSQTYETIWFESRFSIGIFVEPHSGINLYCAISFINIAFEIQVPLLTPKLINTFSMDDIVTAFNVSVLSCKSDPHPIIRIDGEKCAFHNLGELKVKVFYEPGSFSLIPTQIAKKKCRSKVQSSFYYNLISSKRKMLGIGYIESGQ